MKPAALLLALVSPLAAGSARAGEQQGIRVEIGVRPAREASAAELRELREGQEAAIRFRVVDTATGTPVAGASPAAWLDRLDGRREATTCAEEVEQLLSGSYFHRPAVDLNAYHLLALNADASISVLDPLSGFGGSRLLAQVRLDSPGADWALSPDRARLYVSQPDAGKVAAVDTASWRVIAEIAAGPRAGRLALEPDGGRLWVATASGVAAIDTAGLRVAARLATGGDPDDSGERDLALSDDGRRLFVADRAARRLTAIDTAKLVKLRDVPLPAAPTAVAWSPLARAAYAVAGGEGKLFAVDAERLAVTATVEAEPGLGALRFAPGGRLGLVPNARSGRVHVLDAATNRLVQSGEMPDGPDQVTFSDTLAYVRQRGGDSVLMIPLAGLGEVGRRLSVADFPGGQHPPGIGGGPGEPLTLADSIARAPEPGGVLVANAADGAIYYYREGMAAPMGSFQDSGRPRAVLVVDRSLKERSPGSYETVARLPAPGNYRAVFFLDAPRTVQCFALTVAADPALAGERLRERPLAVAPQIASRTVTAGKPQRLRFRLTDPADGRPVDGLADVEVLAFLSSGVWQTRQPARAVGDGVYEAEVSLPAAGSYHVAVECLSGRLAFNRSPQIVLQAVASGAP